MKKSSMLSDFMFWTCLIFGLVFTVVTVSYVVRLGIDIKEILFAISDTIG